LLAARAEEGKRTTAPPAGNASITDSRRNEQYEWGRPRVDRQNPATGTAGKLACRLSANMPAHGTDRRISAHRLSALLIGGTSE